MDLRIFTILVLCCLDITCVTCFTVNDTATGEVDKVCRGTSTGMTLRGDAKFRYGFYKDRYTNCTHINGNLEIVFLTRLGFDLNFLSTIQEVTGYVLLVGIYSHTIPLINLRIIRGRTLYKPESGGQYSLYVALNAKANSATEGLMELQFKSLYEILDGQVFFHNNFLLCYENTILWNDINPSHIQNPIEFSSDSQHTRACGDCDPSCFQNTTRRRHCWGKGPQMCQKLSRGDVCNPSCDGRCFGSLPSQCCHPECAGGCTGPKKTDCWACKHFKNEGECVPYCPNQDVYDDHNFRWIKNPKAKYAYGSLCVKDCPVYLVKEKGGCVKSCLPDSHPVNGTCQPCQGPCPKVCKGNNQNHFIGANTLKDFEGCTVIDGNLRILGTTFQGDPLNNISSVHPSELKVFSAVEEIRGYLMIQSDHPEFTNLSFLRNLKTVRGRSVDTVGNSISIMATPLKMLDLVSLTHILSGKVFITGNRDLCFADTIAFKNGLFSGSRQTATVHNNKDPKRCAAEGLVCDRECSNKGCWGPGPERCLSCRSFQVENSKLCLSSCQDIPKLFDAGKNVCRRCHSECLSTCKGPTSEDCLQCLNVRDGPYCVEKCPPHKYADEFNVCQPCHPNCLDGCTGNSSLVYNGGCVNCQIGIIRTINDDLTPECLPKDSECDDGYFMSLVPLSLSEPMAGKLLCEPCHEECRTCIGKGAGFCKECKNYKFESRCVKSCLALTYPREDKVCVQCHDECLIGCHGPDTTDCTTCKKYKVILNETSGEFNCTQECPSDKTFRVSIKDGEDRVQGIICADSSHPKVMAERQRHEEEEQAKLSLILGCVCGVVVLLGAILVIVMVLCRQRARTKQKTLQLTARMTGFDEIVPMTPTEAKPDLAQLRLIKESELRKGSIIGSGAFGTVYKGLWTPDEENVKIPVAIKVLQEGTSPDQNKELLEEARVMASVDNNYCIRILAVCMTAQMMLITQLMPLGNLLDYVRKNKDHISSKVLLNWCTQIAKGMMYLEERGIVHRDLAARNVLVQAPGHVRITDFGLAKLLDFEEDEYHAAGGKMPIKWLALECIQHRVFTHKSDVWSYGVTVWELFTYGQRPYDSVRARVVPDLLEKGERLSQPSICTIDVYMIMIKCWMLDAESRPSFKELSDEFSKMARDPGRYLVIQGDKLMRLPSHTYDKNDLIRNLSVALDDTDNVMDAEEYLKPQSMRQAAQANNSSPSFSPEEDDLPVWEDERAATNAVAVKEDISHPRREKRYGHLENAAARKRQSPNRNRGDSANSRYSSDPMKMLNYNKDGVDGTTPPLSPNGLATPPVPPLPIDEDDYLQPKSSNPAAYMDLIDSKEYYNQLEKGLLPKIEEKYVPSLPPIMVDNPEYFDQEEDALETDPLNGKSRVSPPSVRDYYNYGKIPREKPHLMYSPNESTV